MCGALRVGSRDLTPSCSVGISQVDSVWTIVVRIGFSPELRRQWFPRNHLTVPFQPFPTDPLAKFMILSMNVTTTSANPIFITQGTLLMLKVERKSTIDYNCSLSCLRAYLKSDPNLGYFFYFVNNFFDYPIGSGSTGCDPDSLVVFDSI